MNRHRDKGERTEVLLVDDHAVLRKGLRLLLEKEEDIKVIAEAGDGQGAIDLVRELSPDVVVMDITMPELGGIEATRRIVKEFPGTKVLALSIHSGKVFVEDMLRAGAVGYLLKESAPEELLEAVRSVARGEICLSRSITGVVVSRYLSALTGDEEAGGWEGLTPGEKEELRLTVEGHSIKQVASIRGVTGEAARSSRSRIMNKLRVANVAQLTELARSARWFEAEGEQPPDAMRQRSFTILKTKLYPPSIPDDYVHRSALIDRLELNRHKPLLLVSAPAGYGKSTLVACWLGSSDQPFAWLNLDENENDLLSFMNYFLSAIDSVLPGAVKETQELLLSAVSLPPMQIAVAGLINELEEIEDAFTLVVDDLHLIQERSVHDFLSELLNHPPRSLHLVLLSRMDPSLPLNALRAGGLVEEIRTMDLQFDAAETSRYLQSKIDKPIDEATAAAWTEKTEGWVTGLRLAALSITHRGEFESLLPELEGSVQYVTEYLFNEVLSIQHQTLRRHLFRSAILDRFCAPLCEALSDPDDDGLSGWEFIRSLQDKSLFIINLDYENRWFRYHHLFQQLLRNQLERFCSSDEITALHSRAGAWFAGNGFIEEAIQHTLAAKDEPGAARLVEQNRQSMLNDDKWFVLEKWLNRLPENLISQRPELLLARAWVFYHHFEIPAIPSVLEAAESLLGDLPEDQPLRGEINFFRGYISYFQNEGSRSLELLRSGRKKIPGDNEEIRGQVEILHGLALQMEGRKEEAIATLNELLSESQGARGVQRTRLLATLVYIHIISGDLEMGLSANDQLHSFAKARGYRYAEAWSLYLQGLINFLRNDLESAKDNFQRAVDKKYLYLLQTRAVFDSMAGLIYACQATGEPENARAVLKSLLDYARHKNDPSYLVIYQSIKARLSVMRGELKSSLGWLRDSPPPSENMVWWLEIPAVTHCRALLAEGSDESLEKAEGKLRELLQQNQDNHNTLQMTDILILQSMVCHKRERTDEALAFLGRALDFGRHGGPVRSFVEAGPPVADLLKRMAEEGPRRDYVREIQSAITDSEKVGLKAPRAAIGSSPGVQPLIEPLSQREIEVLEQLAQRFSNSEIADNLYISPKTVKTHLRNIFQKLAVSGRREAVARAVELGILE